MNAKSCGESNMATGMSIQGKGAVLGGLNVSSRDRLMWYSADVFITSLMNTSRPTESCARAYLCYKIGHSEYFSDPDEQGTVPL